MTSFLTDEQCEQFRRMPWTFHEMLRTVYQAGRLSIIEEITKEANKAGNTHEEHFKKHVKYSANLIVDTVVNVLHKDPHQWSNRPCSTCQAISSLLDKPFGCYRYQKERSEKT